MLSRSFFDGKKQEGSTETKYYRSYRAVNTAIKWVWLGICQIHWLEKDSAATRVLSSHLAFKWWNDETVLKFTSLQYGPKCFTLVQYETAININESLSSFFEKLFLAHCYAGILGVDFLKKWSRKLFYNHTFLLTRVRNAIFCRSSVSFAYFVVYSASIFYKLSHIQFSSPSFCEQVCIFSTFISHAFWLKILIHHRKEQHLKRSKHCHHCCHESDTIFCANFDP